MCVFPDGGRRCDGISEGEDFGRREKLEQVNEAGIWIATSSLPLAGKDAAGDVVSVDARFTGSFCFAMSWFRTSSLSTLIGLDRGYFFT